MSVFLKLHVPGCRYEGTEQPCGSSACHEHVLQEARVLLTDMFVHLEGAKSGTPVQIDGSIASVWCSKYRKLIGHVKPLGS